MCLVSPAAGTYYYKNAERTEEFRLKMVTSDDELTTDIVVEGERACHLPPACADACIPKPCTCACACLPAGPRLPALTCLLACCSLPPPASPLAPPCNR